jgi:hypothetical protein
MKQFNDITEYQKHIALQNALRIKRKIEQMREEDVPFYEKRYYEKRYA